MTTMKRRDPDVSSQSLLPVKKRHHSDYNEEGMMEVEAKAEFPDLHENNITTKATTPVPSQQTSMFVEFQWLDEKEDTLDEEEDTAKDDNDQIETNEAMDVSTSDHPRRRRKVNPHGIRLITAQELYLDLKPGDIIQHHGHKLCRITEVFEYEHEEEENREGEVSHPHDHRHYHDRHCDQIRFRGVQLLSGDEIRNACPSDNWCGCLSFSKLQKILSFAAHKDHSNDNNKENQPHHQHPQHQREVVLTNLPTDVPISAVMAKVRIQYREPTIAPTTTTTATPQPIGINMYHVRYKIKVEDDWQLLPWTRSEDPFYSSGIDPQQPTNECKRYRLSNSLRRSQTPCSRSSLSPNLSAPSRLSLEDVDIHNNPSFTTLTSDTETTITESTTPLPPHATHTACVAPRSPITSSQNLSSPTRLSLAIVDNIPSFTTLTTSTIATEITTTETATRNPDSPLRTLRSPNLSTPSRLSLADVDDHNNPSSTALTSSTTASETTTSESVTNPPHSTRISPRSVPSPTLSFPSLNLPSPARTSLLGEGGDHNHSNPTCTTLTSSTSTAATTTAESQQSLQQQRQRQHMKLQKSSMHAFQSTHAPTPSQPQNYIRHGMHAAYGVPHAAAMHHLATPVHVHHDPRHQYYPVLPPHPQMHGQHHFFYPRYDFSQHYLRGVKPPPPQKQQQQKVDGGGYGESS